MARVMGLCGCGRALLVIMRVPAPDRRSVMFRARPFILTDRPARCPYRVHLGSGGQRHPAPVGVLLALCAMPTGGRRHIGVADGVGAERSRPAACLLP